MQSYFVIFLPVNIVFNYALSRIFAGCSIAGRGSLLLEVCSAGDIEAPFEHTAPPDGCVSLLFYHHAASHSQYLLLVGSVEILRINILPGSVYMGSAFLPGHLRAFLI
ncbi:MAG: hypothetical protein IPJ74_25750 [Saprospiraceae bacterium]|nr:hypothetical protein [Saprospiraceae bacterium]